MPDEKGWEGYGSGNRRNGQTTNSWGNLNFVECPH